jgi:hypothetical protein
MNYRKLRIAWSVVCGIGCVLLVALWVRSYWRNSAIGLGRQGNKSYFTLHRGTVELELPPDISTLSELDRYYLYIRPQIGEQTRGALGWKREPYLSIFFPIPVVTCLVGACGTLPWLPWPRGFSLRTLLIGITLVAVVLGAVVWAVK